MRKLNKMGLLGYIDVRFSQIPSSKVLKTHGLHNLKPPTMYFIDLSKFGSLPK